MGRKKTGYAGDWPGGFFRVDSKGRKVYVIRARLGGKRYQVSTKTHHIEAALAHWKRFQEDPVGYVPYAPAKGPTAPVVLLPVKPFVERLEGVPGLGAEFLRWSLLDKRNSQPHVSAQRNHVNYWAGVLKGQDLRRVDFRATILPAIPGKWKQGRIATLKAFYAWLRKVRHLVAPHEDPTHGALSAPQSDPTKRKVADKSFPKGDFLKARKHLSGHWRNAADIQAATGWHVREVRRFAISGRIERKGREAVLVCPRSKAGREIRTVVSREGLKAAMSLRGRGSLCIRLYGKRLREACEAAGVERIPPGQFRHAVATWAINSGATPEEVSAFLNHGSKQTTLRFYATHSVPQKVPTLL